MPADGGALFRPRVVSIVGTRPEAIKMAPVLRALGRRPELRQSVILTGQHSGLETHFPSIEPDQLMLNLTEHTAGEMLDTLTGALTSRLAALRPDLVLVQGDTASALAGALAARACRIAVGHVEAGLRTGDLQQPWPEEGHRIRIDRIAALLFAPTEHAAGQLRAEGVGGEILVTGNSGIDALLDARGGASAPASGERRNLILVTCHRRENWLRLEGIAAALGRLAATLPVEIAFLLHPNPRLQDRVLTLLGHQPGLRLLGPTDHREMVGLMEQAWLILTDSGGIQEEGPALGRPVLVLREVTERPEAIGCDSIELVGTDPDRIVAAVRRLFRDPDRYAHMARPRFPFGDGKAAPRIAAAVAAYLTPPAALQPQVEDRVVG